MNRDVKKLMFALLRCAICGNVLTSEEKALYSPEQLTELLTAAKKHDVAHLVVFGLKKNNLLDENAKKLEGEIFKAVYRCEQQKHELQTICQTLEDAQIPFVPLKGSVIREYYPEPWMRTSCDIDILIHEDDVEKAISLFERLEYKIEKRNYHDIPMYSPNGIHLELHFNICEDTEKTDKVLRNAWSYARKAESFRYEFEKEFFVFHMYAHMAYHFLAGGCGIRPLLDIWIMENKMDLSYKCAKELLEEAEIYRFAEKMSELAERCFSENDEMLLSDFDAIVSYILIGGIYGSGENSITVKTTEAKSLVAYVFNRLFLPYKYMIILFPILKKAPYLLPFCWVARWLQVFSKKKSGRVAAELLQVKNISDDEMQEINKMRATLGL